MAGVSDQLLRDVKNYLDITWMMSIEETDKLRGMISRGMSYLQGKIGRCDFEAETQEKALLLDYCMYARAGQISEFVQNYMSEILSLQMNRWREKQDAAGEG